MKYYAFNLFSYFTVFKKIFTKFKPKTKETGHLGNLYPYLNYVLLHLVTAIINKFSIHLHIFQYKFSNNLSVIKAVLACSACTIIYPLPNCRITIKTLYNERTVKQCAA